MRAIKVLFLTLSIVALIGAAGCGGKNKKRNTATGDTGSGTGENFGDDGGGGKPRKSGKDPNLQDVIYFAFDSSELDEPSRQKLTENANWLKKDPARTLTIEGHTDEVGTPEYNLGLGERRARTTKDYLVRLGIQEKRVSIITYGEERPAGSEDTKNRRSMFIATKKK
ncbi:MAG TPA: OmpA family protein [Kofleriaceae bacterium]|nr:OmpA family protein [Kofleriaceae bacterium]